MNPNQFTIKAQEVLENSLRIAQKNKSAAVEALHMLSSCFEADEMLLNFILNKNALNPSRIKQKCRDAISKLPKIVGSSANPNGSSQNSSNYGSNQETNPYFSREIEEIFRESEKYLKEFGDKYITVESILLGIFCSNNQARDILKSEGLSKEGLISAIKELRKGSSADNPNSESSYQALEKYAKNLNSLAKQGKLDPVIGRDEEIRRVLQILSRRTKNNPILIGEPGVGKTAIAEGLAQRIINYDVPENLRSKQVFSLDMGALVAGAKYKGEFEERLKSVVKEVIDSQGEIILFIDEIHTLVGAGGGEGAMDAANILKPALARGELRAIGATTLNEYQKFFEKDKALERRFQTVLIDEPSVEDSISILRGLKERYENHHHIRITDQAIIAAVELSHRYISDRFLPDKAIDLIDEASAKLKLEINSLPEPLDELERKIRQLEIEKQALKNSSLDTEIEKLSTERDRLKEQWQKEKALVDGIQECLKNIENYKFEAKAAERDGLYDKVALLRYGKIVEAEKELAKFKEDLKVLQKDTALIKEEIGYEEVAEVIARWRGIPLNRILESEKDKLLHMEDELHKRLIGQEEAIDAVSNAIRRSRAGLSDEKRPIGSFIFLGTTGVGKTELAKTLAQYLFNDEDAIVRIDMSEYQEKHSVSRLVGAPPGYVGYEESGQLTQAVRHKPYSVVLLDEIEKAHPDVFNILLQVLDGGRLTDNKGRTADFKNTIIIMTSNLGAEHIQDLLKNCQDEESEMAAFEKSRYIVLEELKNYLRPEFLNRIDETIVFKPLNRKEVRQIVNIQIEAMLESLRKNGFECKVSNFVLDEIASKAYSPTYGARPIRRYIQKNLINELSKHLIKEDFDKTKEITIDVFDGKFVFYQNK